MKRGIAYGSFRTDIDRAATGQIAAELDPDIVRLAFVSLAMMPVLLKEVLRSNWGTPSIVSFFAQLADFNGRLFASGLAPYEAEGARE